MSWSLATTTARRDKHDHIELTDLIAGSGIADISVSTVGDNIALRLIERGGSIDLITDLQAVLSGGENMVDGNIVTNWGMQTYHQTQTGFDIFNRIIFDLGAARRGRHDLRHPGAEQDHRVYEGDGRCWFGILADSPQ